MNATFDFIWLSMLFLLLSFTHTRTQVETSNSLCFNILLLITLTTIREHSNQCECFLPDCPLINTLFFLLNFWSIFIAVDELNFVMHTCTPSTKSCLNVIQMRHHVNHAALNELRVICRIFVGIFNDTVCLFAAKIPYSLYAQCKWFSPLLSSGSATFLQIFFNGTIRIAQA